MERSIDPWNLLEQRSHFLLGPRGTGKSYLARQLGDRVSYIDLLHSRTFLDLITDPSRLTQYLTGTYVVIDEIQRIPALLNEVHRLIELKNLRFLLTGSSARKLKRSGTNLLAGRAFIAQLFGLTWHELTAAGRFDLTRYLTYGGLPDAYLSNSPEEYLAAYTDTYLREEIRAEAYARNLAGFGRFLETAALCNAQMVNFTKIGNDAQLPPNTVRDYYGLIEDTLLGGLLPAWTKSIKRKAIKTAKFYFFDIGLVHSLLNIRQLERNSDLYGRAFEHFIYTELRSCLAYKRVREKLTYWRSKNNQEVDYLIGDRIAIEVKAAGRVSERDHAGLLALAEESRFDTLLLVSMDEQPKVYPSGIRQLHWQDFLERLWKGEYF